MLLQHRRFRNPLYAMFGGAGRTNLALRRSVRRRRAVPSFNKRVKRIINRGKEKKYHDVTIATSVPISGTSHVASLSLIADGDTDLTRDGEEVRIASIEGCVSVINDADVTADTIYRFIIYRANINIEGVAPAVAEILQSDNVLSLVHRDTKGDYTIYLDKWGIIQPATTTADTHRKIFRFKRIFKTPKLLTFDGSTSAIDDAEKGHWFAILMSNQTTGNQPTWASEIRLRFYDS